MTAGKLSEEQARRDQEAHRGRHAADLRRAPASAARRGHFGRPAPAGPARLRLRLPARPRASASGAGIDELATYLGLKPADLRTQLRSGKSLADIAKAQGKTVADLKTAITDAATKRLDAAVTAGKLTKDQETKILAGLAKHLDDFVNGVHKAGGFGGGWGQARQGGNGPAPDADPTPPAAAPADWSPAPAAA